MTNASKDIVRSYWEAGPCGAKHAGAPEGSPQFFREVEAARNRLEPFIADFADFSGAKGQDVLEVGVGLGTDLVRFARAGANVTGVDLTLRSVELVRRRLALDGLTGDVTVADAERLPFEGASFDVVYSWGVLHHTPEPAAAISEAIRVLRPGGTLCLMLYARRSWVAFGLWARYGLMRSKPQRSLTDVIANHMESRGTRAYTPAEIRALCAGMQPLTVEHVGTPYDRRVGGPVAGATGSWLGWFLVARGRKPLS